LLEELITNEVWLLIGLALTGYKKWRIIWKATLARFQNLDDLVGI